MSLKASLPSADSVHIGGSGDGGEGTVYPPDHLNTEVDFQSEIISEQSQRLTEDALTRLKQ